MSEQRVTGPPRLIEWTGERCVPWTDDAAVIYEHFHRYLFASRLVEGRDVLDLGSGEGFGAALLAGSAASVVGIDIDPQAVEHSRRNYDRPNLEFGTADARELTTFEAGSFGAVVAFEIIEHLAEHERVMDGIAHVLAPDGVVIISSPDRTAYSEDTGLRNPYHVRELTLDELVSMVEQNFSNVAVWAQRTVTGSALLGRGNPAGVVERFVIERRDEVWRLVPGISPMYVIAVASNSPLPEAPADSVLVDPGQELVGTWQRAQASAHAAAQEMQRKYDALRKELLEVGDALTAERRLTGVLEQRAAGDQAVIVRLQTELAGVAASLGWRLYQRLQRVVYAALGGRDSLPGKLLARAVRVLGKLVTH